MGSSLCLRIRRWEFTYGVMEGTVSCKLRVPCPPGMAGQVEAAWQTPMGVAPRKEGPTVWNQGAEAGGGEGWRRVLSLN